MPAKPSWFLRVPEILADLRAISLPYLDRPTIEKLFRIQRRRANQLMSRFPGFTAGRTFLVDRGEMILALETLQRGEEFSCEQHRKTRILNALDEARRYAAARQVLVAVPVQSRNRLLADLPPGITLQPGELLVRFRTAEELLRLLFELSQALANDFPSLQEVIKDPLSS